MYRQIVVPLDGSTFAEAALPLAVALSKRTNARLHLVTVVEPNAAITYAEWEPTAEEWSQEYLPSVAERISGHGGREVTTAFRTGRIVETLLDEARAHHADVVVMASHGRGTLSRACLGSVADEFLREADRPVILIRPTEGEPPSAAPVEDFETLLVPLDGSELSECALAHATELGEHFGSSYHLTRVVPYALDLGTSYLPQESRSNQELLAEEKANAAKYLERHAERMRRRGLRVTTSVAVDVQAGHAGHAILEEAEAVGCDSIAMATHGRTGLRRLILGSVADEVLRGSHVPLLLYRPVRVPAQGTKDNDGHARRTDPYGPQQGADPRRPRPL